MLSRYSLISVALFVVVAAAFYPAFAQTPEGPNPAALGNTARLALPLLPSPPWFPGDEISSAGSGPYTRAEFELDSAIIALQQKGAFTYAVTEDQFLTVLKWDPQPTLVTRLKMPAPISVLYAFGDYLLAGMDDLGIQIIRLEPDGSPQPQEILPSHARITDLAMDDSHLAILEDTRTLRILNYTGHHTLSFGQSWQIPLPTAARSIALARQQVFASGARIGVSVYSLHTDAAPTLQDTFYLAGDAQQIRVVDNRIFIADSQQGITILTLDAAGKLHWQSSHGKLGPANQLWIYQSKLIVANPPQRLYSLDIANPDLPITDSLFKPQRPFTSVAMDDGFVYLSNGTHLQQVDFQTSAAVQISNEGINLGGSRRAFVENKIAYVADWFSGLHIYDLRIPHQPRHIGNFHTPGSSKGVVVKDGIAYVGDDDHGLQIIDVSDPINPRKLSEVVTPGLAYTLKLRNKTVYLADHRGGFHIIDVSDASKPRIIGSYDTPGKSWAIEVKDQNVYVADDLSGLLIFDISKPAKPKQIGQYKPGGYAEDVFIRGNFAYVSFFDQGLHIIDIRHPRRPVLVGRVDIPGNARSVEIQGNFAYVAGWESGLHIIDIRQAKSPRAVAYLDTNGSTWGANVDGDHAYLWDWWGGIKVVDVHDPLQPRLVGQYQARGDIQYATRIGDYAFLAQGASGVQVFDISNPANPIWVTGIDLAGYAQHISSEASQLFVALGDGGVAMLDATNPFQLRWQNQISLPGETLRVRYHNGVLYTANSRGELRGLNLSDPLNPVFKFSLPLAVTEMTLVGDTLFAIGAQGLSAFALTNQVPLKIADFKPANPLTCLSAINDWIAVCESDTAVHLLQLKVLPLKGVEKRAANFEKVSRIAIRGPHTEIQLTADRIYINQVDTGTQVYQLDESKKPHLRASYPTTGRTTSFLLYKNTLLFSGDTTLASLPLLPDLGLITNDQGQLQVQLPDNFPLGHYHLNQHSPNGETHLHPNAIFVKPGTPSKPALSLEKFKQLMQQYLQK